MRLFVGNDNRELGRQLADKIIDKLPADVTGTIVIGNTTPGTHALDQRSDGMRERIRERLPAVRVTGPFETKRDPQVNLASWSTIVNAYPRALAFLGTGNYDSVSLATLRKPGSTWVGGGFDLEHKALAAVKSGGLTLMSPEHFTKGAIAGRVTAKFVKNGTAVPKGFLVVPGLPVTTDNVDEVMARQASIDARTAYTAPVIDKLSSDPAAMRPLP